MILTCPNCGTRYFLPDVQVGRAGRAVKCTTCGTVWRAEAPEPEPPPLSHQFAPEAPEGYDEEHEPPRMAFPDPEADFAAAAARRAEILREKKAEAERKQRQAGVITAAIWAGLVASVAILLAMAFVFRIQVVRWWPGAASAYAALGMPINASGLLIDKVAAAPAIAQGHRALKVTGVLTNASAGPRQTPAFHVNVLDKNGKVLAQKVIQVPAVGLKVGEARRFELEVIDPPAGADNVEVTLALPDATQAPPRPAPQVAPPAPPPPAPAATPAAASSVAPATAPSGAAPASSPVPPQTAPSAKAPGKP